MIYNLFKNSVHKYGNNIAVQCDGKKLTYTELDISIKHIANELKRKGIRQGDHIAIFMDNSVEYIKAFYSINLCNAVIIPIYTHIGREKFLRLIEFLDVKYIISTSDYKEFLSNETIVKCQKLSNIFLLYNDDVKDIGGFYKGSIINKYYEETPAVIMLSSGTTNLPKGIMLSNKNIKSNINSISSYLELNNKDKVLLVKNLTHSSSITGEMLTSLSNGCTLYLTQKIITPSMIIKLISELDISIFFGTPNLLTLILENNNIAKYNFKKLRKINFYGSKMDVNIIQRLCDTFTDSEIIYSYGLTEASPRVSYIKKNDLLNKKGSSGKPIKDVSIFIENKNKKELGPGMVGEIVVTGPNVMMGYYKNLDLTRKALNKSKLYTGDIGFIDQDGFLFIKGRKDNMLNVAGKNVYAEEIEEILCSIEGVKESLVTGKKDKFYGDKLIAYIVKNEKIDTEEILSYLKLYLDNYKVPHEIICVKSLEKTVSGKIVRKEVKNYE